MWRSRVRDATSLADIVICFPSSTVVVGAMISASAIPLSLPAPVPGAVSPPLTINAIKPIPFFGSVAVALPLVLLLLLLPILVFRVAFLSSFVTVVLEIVRIDQVSVKYKLVNIVDVRKLGLLSVGRR